MEPRQSRWCDSEAARLMKRSPKFSSRREQRRLPVFGEAARKGKTAEQTARNDAAVTRVIRMFHRKPKTNERNELAWQTTNVSTTDDPICRFLRNHGPPSCQRCPIEIQGFVTPCGRFTALDCLPVRELSRVRSNISFFFYYVIEYKKDNLKFQEKTRDRPKC